MWHDLVRQSAIARGCGIGCVCVYSVNYQYMNSEICMHTYINTCRLGSHTKFNNNL